MKSRERQASGGRAPQATTAGILVRDQANGTNGHHASAENSLLWEDWYQFASAEQRAEVLALARRQGLLYVQQLPAHANGHGHAPAPATVEPTQLQTLKEMLAGRVENLPTVEAASLEFQDAELDPLQRQAVARALSTPDICLIYGAPGTGKTRVIVEILAQASARGLRALFLAHSPACVDNLLKQLACQPRLLPIRLAAAGETIAPAAQPMLLPARKAAFRTQVLEKAMQTRDLSEATCGQRQAQTETWPRFLELIEQARQVEEKLQKVRDQLAQASAEVERNAASTLGEKYVTLVQKHDADQCAIKKSQSDLDNDIAGQEKETTRLAEELREVEAAANATWFSPARWKALFRGISPARKTSLEAELKTSQASLTSLRQKKADLGLQGSQAEQAFQAARQAMLGEEIAVRQTSLTEAEAHAVAELARIDQQWATLSDSLLPEKVRPQTRTAAAVDQAHQLWQQQKLLDEESCSLARQWVAFLQDTGPRLAERLPGLASIIAATVAGWKHEGASIPAGFDLLIIDEADQLAEPTLLQLAPLAKRWVLVSNYLGPIPAALAAPANPREVRPAAAKPGVLQRLWQTLHADLAHLPYSWRQEKGQLICQLRPLTSQERSRLERECLADSPDIELHILNVPRAEPLLAQVAFPAGTSLFDAKEFIFRELQEIPLQTAGRNGWVEEHADQFLWRMLPDSPADCLAVNLELGLRERITGSQTVCLEFSKSHWSRGQVADWTQRRFRHRDLGRTVFLQVPHRMQPALARWVDDVLFPGTLAAHSSSEKTATQGGGMNQRPVTFMAITPAKPAQNGAGHGHKPAREPVGLEIDLAANKAGERVPQDLLAGLPRHGYANYREAQAVVSILENLAKDQPQTCCHVLAFFPGQVELIRRLLSRSTALAGRNVQVGLPSQLAQEQCQAAIVSLTRSNGQKSGIFVAEQADPILALTRARERLILVGDPDTLLRWSQSSEPAESADPGRDKAWVRRLASYVRGHGSHQAAFHLCDAPTS